MRSTNMLPGIGASEEFDLKQRLITAGVGLAVLVVAFVFFDTLLLNCLGAFISALAVYELFQIAGLHRYRLLLLVSMIYSVELLFLNTHSAAMFFVPASIIYVIFGFCYLLARHHTLSINHLCYCFVTTILVSLSFYSLVQIRDESTPQLGLFYLIVIFGSAWWSDSGAYFVGIFWGRHKLCPAISPQKTIEGLLGGIGTAILGNVMSCGIYLAVANAIVPFGYFTNKLQISFGLIIAISPLLSFLGILGDLSASIIKRQNGVKDFGMIMPGHGGIMDRFDSVLFISPVVFWIFRNFPLATIL